GHGDDSFGAAHSRKLGGNQLGTRRKHRSEHGHDYIEVRIEIGQLLGVTFFECCLQTFFGGPGARLFHEVGSDVDTGDLRAFARCRYCQIAGSAGDVEHPRVRRNGQAADKFLSTLWRIAPELAKVTGHPRTTHSLLELFETRGCWLHVKFLRQQFYRSRQVVVSCQGARSRVTSAASSFKTVSRVDCK